MHKSACSASVKACVQIFRKHEKGRRTVGLSAIPVLPGRDRGRDRRIPESSQTSQSGIHKDKTTKKQFLEQGGRLGPNTLGFF